MEALFRFLEANDSSVPRIGFPVGYAVSWVLLLTVFGYLAIVLS